MENIKSNFHNKLPQRGFHSVFCSTSTTTTTESILWDLVYAILSYNFPKSEHKKLMAHFNSLFVVHLSGSGVCTKWNSKTSKKKNRTRCARFLDLYHKMKIGSENGKQASKQTSFRNYTPFTFKMEKNQKLLLYAWNTRADSYCQRIYLLCA